VDEREWEVWMSTRVTLREREDVLTFGIYVQVGGDERQSL
jgi:hypothetical protein